MEEPVCYSGLAGFDGLATRWRVLWQKKSDPSPLTTFEFVQLWYRCFAAGPDVRVYPLVEGGETVGYLPMVRRFRLGVRILKPLIHSHCYHPVQLMAAGYEGRAGELARQALAKDRNGWDVLHFDHFYSFAETAPLIEAGGGCWEARFVDGTTRPTYVIRLRKTMDEYLFKDLAKKTRNAVSRFKNRLAKFGDFRLRVSAGRTIVNDWHLFTQIEDSGWKAAEGSSIRRCGEAVARYYEGLIKILADTGAGTLFFLELDHLPIAGAFGYREGRVFHCWKTGFLESHGKFSPSNVLMNLMVEHLIQRNSGIELVHLFPGDYGYKHRIANEPASCGRGWVFNSTWRGSAARWIRGGKRWGKGMFTRQCATGNDVGMEMGKNER